MNYIIFEPQVFNWFDFFQTVAALITAGSIIFALREYRYKKEQDKKLAIADQISFFRTEVIPKYTEFIKFVRSKKGDGYVFKRVQIDDPTVKYTREHYLTESQEQASILKECDTLQKQTDILNLLEEISIRIMNFDTTKHDSLNSIKTPFIEMVEVNAVMLLLQRNIITGDKTYTSILNLYGIWKDEVDRRPPESRLQDLLDELSK